MYIHNDICILLCMKYVYSSHRSILFFSWTFSTFFLNDWRHRQDQWRQDERPHIMKRSKNSLNQTTKSLIDEKPPGGHFICTLRQIPVSETKR